MPRFHNVWDDSEVPAQRCIDCGEVVHGLEGMQQHVCQPREEKGTWEGDDFPEFRYVDRGKEDDQREV